MAHYHELFCRPAENQGQSNAFLYRLAQGLLEDGTTHGGVCIHCGGTVESGVEPDARDLTCPHCSINALWGAEEAFLTFM